jgi:hypothetical protein
VTRSQTRSGVAGTTDATSNECSATRAYGPSSTANNVASLIAYTVPSGPMIVGV